MQHVGQSYTNIISILMKFFNYSTRVDSSEVDSRESRRIIASLGVSLSDGTVHQDLVQTSTIFGSEMSVVDGLICWSETNNLSSLILRTFL